MLPRSVVFMCNGSLWYFEYEVYNISPLYRDEFPKLRTKFLKLEIAEIL